MTNSWDKEKEMGLGKSSLPKCAWNKTPITPEKKQFLELKEISTGKLAKGGCIPGHSQFTKDAFHKRNKNFFNKFYHIL